MNDVWVVWVFITKVFVVKAPQVLFWRSETMQKLCVQGKSLYVTYCSQLGRELKSPYIKIFKWKKKGKSILFI